ncbi:MAG TPA: WD40 repeat domain-containing protein, partial [Thermoleophilia bacterium]|nr:WD40 repeat domain-containing protein [Thermoleophilia bacterium]
MQPPSRGLGGDHESLRSALVAFARAVSLENDQLTRGPVGLLPQFVFQQLYNRLQWLTEETAPAALLKSLRVESATRSEAGAQVWAHSLAPYRESPALVRVLRGHSGPVGDCAVSPDGSMLASASWDGTVRLWELRSGVQVALLLDEHAGTSAEACLFSPDGAVVATRYAWGALKVWRADDGEEIGGAWPRDKSDARVDAPTALAISPRGHLLASGHRSGDLRLWDWSTGLAAASLRGHEGLVTACSFAPDGTRIVSASADGTLRVSLVTGAGPAAVLRAPDGAADMVGWVGDGEAVVSAGADHGLRVWPLAVGGSSVSIEDAASKPTCLAIDPEGVRAAVGHDDGSVTLWSAADGRRLATLAGHGGAVACCAFSPSGGWLVTGGESRPQTRSVRRP